MEPNVFETANAGFAQAMYEEFLKNPESVAVTDRGLRLLRQCRRGRGEPCRHVEPDYGVVHHLVSATVKEDPARAARQSNGSTANAVHGTRNGAGATVESAAGLDGCSGATVVFAASVAGCAERLEVMLGRTIGGVAGAAATGVTGVLMAGAGAGVTGVSVAMRSLVEGRFTRNIVNTTDSTTSTKAPAPIRSTVFAVGGRP